MSMIKVENLTFAYPRGRDYVFENVSFQIDTDWKLGFVGRNGRGKTTFLNLLLGKYEYSGKIISSVQFDYFPYPVEDKEAVTMDILQKVCPLAEEWEIMRELSLLNVETEVLYRSFETLSNGEQTKALLAALFLNEEYFLLIDEPTNHLDTKGRKQVADYLKKKKGFILVSHDRRFLDTCVDHILSLNRANIEVQSGNFSSFMINFERQNAFESVQNEKLQKSIKQLHQSARRSAIWSDCIEAKKSGAYDKGYVGHKSAKMMKRSKAIESRTEQAIEQKSKLLRNMETAEELKLFPQSYHSDLLAAFSDAAVSYEGTLVSSPVSFSINRGDRIALDGRNGSGKSSILKLLVGENITHIGNVKIGTNLVVSYVPQDISFLKGSVSDFADENNMDESLLKTVLSKLDFNEAQLSKDMRDFSEGQKKKVLLAKSLCEKAHLYIWDEPLNFIDVYSRMQLEQLIQKFSPTMIFVEHDSVFRETIATKIIEL